MSSVVELMLPDGGLSLSGGTFLDKTSRDSCPKYHSPLRELMKEDVFSLSSFFNWMCDALFAQSLKKYPLH